MNLSAIFVRWLLLASLLLLGVLGISDEAGLAGGKKGKKDPEHHWGVALKQLKEAKQALAHSLSKEASERKLEQKVIHELEKAIESVNRAINHIEAAHKADKKN